jgi:hypothetical protein
MTCCPHTPAYYSDFGDETNLLLYSTAPPHLTKTELGWGPEGLARAQRRLVSMIALMISGGTCLVCMCWMNVVVHLDLVRAISGLLH